MIGRARGALHAAGIAAGLAAGLAWSSAACSRPAPPVEGVGPSSNARAVESPSQKPVELARPDAPAAPKPAVQNPVVKDPVVQAPPVTLGDLGPIQVMTWEDARLQAEQRITAETADAELAQLQSELQSGP